MKRMKKYLLLIAVMAVSIISLCFSAGAEYVTHDYWEFDDWYENLEPIPLYLDNANNRFKDTYKYSFDSETGVLVIAPGKEETTVLPRNLLNGYLPADPEAPDCESIAYFGIDIDKEKIRHVIVEDGFTELYETFSDLKNLETIVLPDTLTTISNKSFLNCSSLKNFILPSSVTYVGKRVFEGCTSLTKVYYEGAANLDLPGDAAVPNKINWFTVNAYADCIYLHWGDSDEYTDYYRLYRWDYSKKKWNIIADKITERTYKYPCKTVPGEKYRFAVRPVNVNGSDTKWNDFTAAEAVYLISLQLKATALTGGYKLTWNKVPGAMGYQIWYSTKLYGTYKRYKNAYTESFTKTGLKKGTTYYFQVRPVAELSNGTYQVGNFSAPVKVTVK